MEGAAVERSPLYNAPAFFAAGLAIFGALLGLPEQPEHELHLFLSSHYVSFGTALFDPRWYTGFSVAGHPPLAHLLCAALSKLPGLNLERAYALLLIATAIGFSSGAQRLVAIFAPSARAAIGALAATFPLLYLFLFPLGQWPFVLAWALAFHSATLLVHPSKGRAIPAGCLASAALCTHPWAAIALTLCYLGVALALWQHAEGSVVSRLKALMPVVVAGIFAITSALVFCWPFFELLLHGDFRPVASAKLWAMPYIPPALAALLNDKLVWVFGLLVLATLALLPARFRTARTVWAVVCGVLSMNVTTVRNSTFGRQHRQAMQEIAGLLSQSENASTRYMTLGIGPERLELGRRSLATSIDGGLPHLRAAYAVGSTNYATLDALPMAEAPARAVLQRVLNEAVITQLAWVISREPAAADFLTQAGFRIHHAWKGGIVLWGKDMKPAQAEPIFPRQHWALWVYGPLAVLLLALTLTSGAYFWRHMTHIPLAAAAHSNAAAGID